MRSRKLNHNHFGRGMTAVVSFIVPTLLIASTAYASTGTLGGDSANPTASGLDAYCSGANFDMYVGQVGTFQTNGGTAYEGINSGYNQSTQINQAYNQLNAGHGIGVGSYFFLGSLNSTHEALNGQNATEWGIYQGDEAAAYFDEANSTTSPYEVNHYTENIIYGDFESYGEWSSAYQTLNDDVWYGFVEAVEGNNIAVGAYTSADYWSTYFGNPLVTVAEWTSETSENTINVGYCPGATAFAPFNYASGKSNPGADFYGGSSTSSSNALVWQWSYSTSSTPGDFDQANISHWNTFFHKSYSP